MVTAIGVRTREKSTKSLFEKLNRLAKEHSVLLQAFNPDAILSARHLEHAFELANRAFKSDSNVARSLEAELLLRAAGTEKIDKAIERIGVKDPKRIILFSDRKLDEKIIGELGKKENKLLEQTEQKKKKIAKLFGISDSELKLYSLEELVLERMAVGE